jgi:hypothetical protein
MSVVSLGIVIAEEVHQFDRMNRLIDEVLHV